LIGLVAGIAIGWYVQGLRWDADIAERDKQQFDAQSQRSDVVTANVITSMRIINTITRANADAKQQIQRRSENTVVYIREKLSTDECAVRPVPDDVVSKLREHADRIRHSSNGADSH
ncbi:hypothetical protein, partial [Pectobacterium versatile]|uniref:hypothetical protein n=1 Tax=Pectobacterium versatile TaxID=2488639 RepID=UPI001B36AE51